MRSKRLLTMILTVAMLVSMLSPAAYAVAPGGQTAVSQKTQNAANNKNNASTISSELVASADAQTEGLNTLRDNGGVKPATSSDNTVDGNGAWTAVETESDAQLPKAELPACIQELREAAEIYAADRIVTAFVVMESAPLSEKYSSISRIDLNEEKGLLTQQDRVIAQIEKQVLKGAELKVRYQFTYLTNSFTIETEFGNLEQIAMMDGVKSVFLMPVYEPCTTDGVASPNTATSASMTGVAQVWSDLGYTGAGMKIAIIDTGLDLDHPSFAAAPQLTETSMTVEDIAAVLTDLNAYASRNMITADTLYRSEKVPFAFNYCDSNLTADHSSDMQGDHGTHVAGIAAANAIEGSTVVGMAPDAQIIVMKVFGAAGGAYTDDIVAALEDAMILGCDVVNGSLGSPAGFSSTDTEIDLIFQRLDQQDIVACFSAGNEGTSAYANMWGTDLNRTQNPDNSAIGQPGTYTNIMTVASADNAGVLSDYFVTASGAQIFYGDSMEATYAAAGYAEYWPATCLNTMAGETLEYVIINGLGYEEEFYDEEWNSLVEGKIAVVNRGEISFSEKVFNAMYAGAIAVIVVDQNYNDVFNFGMSIAMSDEEGNPIDIPSIPAVLIDTVSGQALAASEEYTLTVSAEQAMRTDAHGGQMSSFSSWGVTPDLRLEPDITGIGGNVYSTLDGGQYGLMSGTSMSSPQVAGVTALVMQYLYTLYPNAEPGAIRDLAEALLMSTADPIVDPELGVLVSPRQQGAGLVDAYEAVTTKAYLTVNGEKPKVSLGDSTTGTFTFTFEIHNFSDAAKTYTLNGVLESEAVVAYGDETFFEYFMAGYNTFLSGAVTFDQNTVTVPAGGEVQVKVTITLSDEDKAYFAECWENGGYVEGYVCLTNEEGAQELNLPFLGFYGDWTEAPVFDTAYWYDNSFWDEYTELPDGDEYWHVLWTTLGGIDWVTGINPYSGYALDENGKVSFDPARNVVSPNGDGYMDGLIEIYLSLLRSAKTLTFTYTANDQVLHTETITHNSKTMYISSYGQVIPWLYSWYSMGGIFSFTDANGEPLPSGTVVKMTVDATVDYADGGDHTLEFELVVDTNAPELVSLQQAELDGRYYLVVEAKDDTALAAAFLTNPSGSQIYGATYDFQMTPTESGTYLSYFDVTGYGTEFQIALGDYGANESYYDVSYEAEDGNLPVMDTDLLYAYRVYDSMIMSDSMYGWVSMSKPTEDDWYAMVNTLTDDSLEYAAINAAEYVGGKIFAIDAVGNLVVLDAGLFNRNFVTNLGVSVLDMTFDDSTDTMYVLGYEDYMAYLYELDLVTAELTVLAEYGYYEYGPWAIADDDNGTIYAIQNSMSGIYVMTADNGYVMEPVTLSDGTLVEIYDAYGNPVSPYYAQSMTYADGMLYWAYYASAWYGDSSQLLTINTSDWSTYGVEYVAEYYDSFGNLFEDYPVTELVGLLTLTETDYQLPEAEALLGLALDAASMLMMVGESTSITAAPTPWNYELTDVVWSSSDEQVATVVDGKVTAVGAGTAIITATAEGFTASCEVTVMELDGNFYAYNYFSGDGYYGYMIEVDLETMNYSLLAGSNADFLAGDYNGHDGYFYGYTEGGQFWRYDYETGEAISLGNALGYTPTDMAYNYTNGLMYATTLDYNTGISTLSVVNLLTGALETVYESYENMFMTLACDGEGNFYAIDSMGTLGIFVSYYDEFEGMDYWYFEPLMYGLGNLNYAQSMCWDYNNGGILWTNPESSLVFWIDPVNGYTVTLGDPSESGLIEFVGMYTLPEIIMELPYVAVEYANASDLTMLVGATKFPVVDIRPANATNHQILWSSSNPNVAVVNDDGSITAVAEGTALITGVLQDGENTLNLSFEVKTLISAEHIYGHVLTDLATYAGQYWVRIYPENPASPDYLGETAYVVFAEEYVDGKLYAYGYDPNDWEGNWQRFILDANTFAVYEQLDMGEGFPYIYDMTYDYTTGTMFAVAGAGETDTDLYILDMETGAATLLMKTEPLFLGLAAGPNGILYAMESSQAVLDEYGWETGEYTDATLYTIDPYNQIVTEVGTTGMKSNMIASMTYDYDTDYLYWTPLFSGMSYVSALAMVDPATGEALSLGVPGGMGAQISGLYIPSENVPEMDLTTVKSLILTSTKEVMAVGSTVSLNTITIPAQIDAPIVWTSSNSAVASVDAEGNVTAIGEGRAVITATINVNGVRKTAKCSIAVLAEDASFLTWNETDGVWASINRADVSVVTNLTEYTGETEVVALAAIGTDVYGYDADNQLFQLNTETFERTNIGDGLGLEVDAENGYAFKVRDMAYDAAGERMLVLGETLLWDPFWEEYSTIYGGSSIYTVDLTTGALELVFTFNDLSDVKAITADLSGNVYTYSTFNDHVHQVNLDNGTYNTLVSLQTQSVYGDYMSDFALFYDELSGYMYLLFTSSGMAYQIHTIDAATGSLTQGGYVGEIEADDWSVYGYMFNGLVYVNDNADVHVCDFLNGVCQSCGAREDLDFGAMENPFVDVASTEYFYEPIMWAVHYKLTSGATANTFEPNEVCTRAQMVTFIWRTAGCPAPTSNVNPFTDVNESHYFYNAVLWAVENGITAGTTATTFSPDDDCTRAQAVTFLYRWKGTEPAAQDNRFVDVKSEDYFYNAVLWAVENGITVGATTTTFEPEQNCTRGQIMTFLYRLWF